MTELRIRIPKLRVCPTEECTEYIREDEFVCRECLLHTIRLRLEAWMGEEMTTAAFARQSKFIHSPAFRRFLRG